MLHYVIMNMQIYESFITVVFYGVQVEVTVGSIQHPNLYIRGRRFNHKPRAWSNGDTDTVILAV